MPYMPEIIVIAHNIRSTHNVGAIFRTAEGFGISKIILSGYTPYPRTINDSRLPHIADKLISAARNSDDKFFVSLKAAESFSQGQDILR